ncbi:hypothetical protein CVT24_012656 [Panaeolus cyanescens]|uniref:Uncharacterized protein n=1 Tax=Panaeolus cyanescens TaxID=181874 RepID=A0A409WKI7_9AGAR|nr:hypothetical protein CVT24_012656 [Panaeolus cyanescens]
MYRVSQNLQAPQPHGDDETRAGERNTGETIDEIDEYWKARPIGYFMDYNGNPRSFSSLSYMEYYSLFQLIKFTITHNNNPMFFPEVCNRADSPRMTAVLRSHANPHITRIQTLRPSNGDIFYLRLILLNKPINSFLDARTVNGVEYSSFQEAAVELGVFTNADEGILTLREAITSLRTPREIRSLFVDLLVNDSVEQPYQAWLEIAPDISYDFYYNNHLSGDIAVNLTLQELSVLLAAHGRELQDFGLPSADIQDVIPLLEIERWSIQDPLYANWVDSIGNGFGPNIDLGILPTTTSYRELISFVFPLKSFPIPTNVLHETFWLLPINKSTPTMITF